MKYGLFRLGLIVIQNNPRFQKGDLVMFRDNSVYEDGDLGIIVSDPVLYFINKWNGYEDPKVNYWVYDIMIRNQLIREIPEQMIEGLKDENEEDSE